MRSIPETILVEGDRCVLALLESPFILPIEVILEEGRYPGIQAQCEKRGIPFRLLARTETPAKGGVDFQRGACAVAQRPSAREPDAAFLESARRLLIPIDFSDGGNLGPLIRTAVAFGIDGIVVEAGRGVDIFSPKCLRSSANAIFRVPVFEAAHLSVTLERIAESGFVLLGVSNAAESLPLPEVSPGRRTAVLFGAEDKGLPLEVESQCAQLMRVPVQPEGTLNAAAEGSIVLYELFGRQGEVRDTTG